MPPVDGSGMIPNGVAVIRHREASMKLSRRVLLVDALAAISPFVGQAQSSIGRSVLYAAVGTELTQYDVDVSGAALTKKGSVTLPDMVQYAWQHPSRKYLYVAWSNGAGKDHHGVSAYRIDAKTGVLSLLDGPVALANRPIHLSVDIPGTHALIAYSEPSGVTVHNLAADGTVGSEVRQPEKLDTGIYAHQVRVDPSNRTVILVTRGNGPTNTKAEDPGALKVFEYKDGVLKNRQSVAPDRGFGFQPRHLDFEGPWLFVSLERQSKLQTFKKMADGTLSTEPLFTKDSLPMPRAGQAAGTVHVHPNGKFVYQANRAGGTLEYQGKRVSAGGENSIAVYAIKQETGEPVQIQTIDTRGFVPRTFALDASGRILVAANQNAMLVRDGDTVKMVPASLAVFRVGSDGKLDYVRKYDVPADDVRTMFWMGIVALP
jgi:6-phosphogluconolactonase (cycloisomerase 2 family)